MHYSIGDTSPSFFHAAGLKLVKKELEALELTTLLESMV